MTDNKQTMYEILEVSPSASLPEIKAAHKLLTRSLISEKLGLRREEIELKLQMLDVALNTLSNQAARDAYDAQLASRKIPANIALSPITDVMTRGSDSRALMLAAAIVDTHKMAAYSGKSHVTPLAIMSTTVDSSVSSIKKILRAITGLLAMGAVIKVALMILANNRPERPPDAVSKTDEKVIIQEYYQQNGVRPGSKAEVDLLEIENRRKVNEQRAAELEQKKKDEEYSRFVEESKRKGEQVSYDMQRAEEQARYQSEREKQRLQQEEIQKEQAERERIAEARRKLGLN